MATSFNLTVVPGVQLPTGVPVLITPDILNKLGNPTVTFNGAITGAVITAGTLEATAFASDMITSLPTASANASNLFLTWDVGNGVYASTSLTAVAAQALGSLTAYGASTPALTDTVPFVHSGTNYSISLGWFFGGVISGQSALAVAVAPGADYVLMNSAATAAPGNVKVPPATLVRSVTDVITATAGTSSAYTLSPGSGLTYAALAEGARIVVRWHIANSGGATLNVSGLGAKAIRRNDDSAPNGGELVAGQVTELAYAAAGNSGAGSWQVLGGRGGGAFAWGKLLVGTVPPTNAATGVSGNTFTVNSGLPNNGDWIYFVSSYLGLSAYTPYWVVNSTGTPGGSGTFQVSATLGGAAATVSNSGATSSWYQCAAATLIPSGSNVAAWIQNPSIVLSTNPNDTAFLFQLWFSSAAASASYSIQMTMPVSGTSQYGAPLAAPINTPGTSGFQFIAYDQLLNAVPQYVSVLVMS